MTIGFMLPANLCFEDSESGVQVQALSQAEPTASGGVKVPRAYNIGLRRIRTASRRRLPRDIVIELRWLFSGLRTTVPVSVI